MRLLLMPLSVLFRFIIFIRNKLFDWGLLESKKFNAPVIAIGNITVGGTGKTPHAEYLIHWLSQKYQVALVSRGYKRESKGYFEVLTHSTVSQSGDEPLQIKQKFPHVRVVVYESRVHAIDKMLQEPNAPHLVILDDAFQHRHVNAGLKILLIDYHRPVFNDYMLPAGSLREPAKNLQRADIILVTKCPLNMVQSDYQVFATRLQPGSNQELFFTSFGYRNMQPVFENESFPIVPTIKESDILVVTGIANPKPFYQMLEDSGAVLHKMAFPDHHSFSEWEVKQIANRFASITKEHKYIITTEKDAVRLKDGKVAHIIGSLPVYYIPIEVTFLNAGEEKFKKRVESYLSIFNA